MQRQAAKVYPGALTLNLCCWTNCKSNKKIFLYTVLYLIRTAKKLGDACFGNYALINNQKPLCAKSFCKLLQSKSFLCTHR